MTRAKRVGRWALIGIGGLLALFVLLWLGVGVYLRSSAGREMVANKLQAAIGLPVHVSSVSLGARSSSLKFRILDPKLDPANPQAAILSVDSATADLSLAELVAGHANPHEIHLHGLDLILRLDAKGNLLTTLPDSKGQSTGGEVPRIVLESGRIRIQQEGRPEFTLNNIQVNVEPKGDALAIAGTVDDPGWGKWSISGELNKNSKSGWVETASEDVTLAPDRLATLPAVPDSLWKNARPEGHVKPKARIEIDSRQEFQYDARLEANNLALSIPPAEITLTDASAVVHVRNGIVEVMGKDGPSATAKLAGGTVQANAKWEFDKDPAVGDPIAVSVKNLAVKQLPEKWGLKNLGGQLPGKLSLENGFLTGDAKLRLVAHSDGRLETYGGGSGAVHVPGFEGGTLDVAVRLGGDGQKLEFQHAAAPPKPPMKKAGAKPGIPPEILLALVTLQQKTDPPKKDDSQPTNLDATITLRDIDIVQFLEQMEIKVPYKISGKATVQAKFGVPLQEANTRSSYHLTGTLTSPELHFEGLIVRDFKTEIVLQNGKLTLSHLKGTIPQGTGSQQGGAFSGTATAAISPPGDVTAKLTLDHIPLASVAAAIPNNSLGASGRISGHADFQAPLNSISDSATWKATAALNSEEMTIAGRTIKGFTFSVAVVQGVATIKDASVTVEGVPITAAGSLTLSGKYPFEATVKTTGTSIADLRKLVPEAQLPVPVEGVLSTSTQASGTLSPMAFTVSGTVTATKLTLAKTSANHIELKWDLSQDRLRITDLNAGVFGGTITGSLDYPFSPEKKGDFAISFKDVDAAAASAFVPDVPVKITGALSGKVMGTIPPAKNGGSRIGDLDIDLTAPKLTVQNIPAERLVGKAAIKSGALDYSLEGKTLGGSFEVKGRYPGASKPDKDKDKGRGSLRITDLDLSRLAGALKSQSLKPLGGRIDVLFDYDNDLSTGSGRLIIRGLRWGKEFASPEMIGVLLLREDTFELRDLTGSLAGGTVRGRGRINMKNPSRNFFSLGVDRADAARLTAAIPEAAGLVKGQVSLAVHGSFGREVRGSGTVTFPRGSIAGVDVGDLRIPFQYATAPGGSGHLAIREATSQSGSGRASGNLTIDWGSSVRVAGQVRMIDVPLRSFSPTLGENAFLGSGRITGRVDLSGTEVRSIDDLTGNLVATLTNASPKEIPLLQLTMPYLNTVGLAKPFQSGDIRGTLSRGIFRIQRLALSNPGAQLFADGNITVQNGRLDLSVIAHTGQVGVQGGGLRLLAMRIPIAGPLPITLIRDVNDLLTNRTIKLSVTGTVDNPVVRVNTAALLGEEAIRFLLSRYVLPADASAALGFGTLGTAK